MHAAFCYGIGIFTMEIVRARGASWTKLIPTVLRAMFSNALILGIGLGFVVNILEIPLPATFTDAVDLMVAAALPAALFGMGGVLYRYRPEGDTGPIILVCGLSLIAYPALVWGTSAMAGLSKEALRSAVLTSAMAPGINTYVFANLYGVARRVGDDALAERADRFRKNGYGHYLSELHPDVRLV